MTAAKLIAAKMDINMFGQAEVTLQFFVEPEAVRDWQNTIGALRDHDRAPRLLLPPVMVATGTGGKAC